MLTEESQRTVPSRAVRSERRSAAAVVVAVLAAVLAVDPVGSRPFTTLRWAVVAVAVLVAGAFVWRRRIALPGLVTGLGLAFLAWMALAALAADDGLVPWLGHPRRHLGLVAWIVCAVACVVGASLDRRGRRALAVSASIGSAALGLGALLELAGVSVGGVAFPGPRAGGFSGQPAYLGALGVLLVPMAVAVASAAPRRLRWVAWSCVGLGVTGVISSQTRGALVALLVAAVLGATRLRRRSWVPAVAAAGVFVLALVMMASPLGGRLLSTMEGGHSQGQGRFDQWRVATSVIADHPILGVGPEGYRLVATEHIDADYSARYGRDVIVDRAHDAVLDVTVVGGLPAGVLYVALSAVVAVRMWRARRARSPLVAGAAVAVLAYGVQQVVLFPLAEIDPVAWLFVGVALAGDVSLRSSHAERDAGVTPRAPTRRGPSTIVATTVGLALALLAGAMAVLGVLDVASDRQMADAQRLLVAGRTGDALAAADRATRLRPDSLDAWFVAARVAAAGESLVDVDVALDRVESGLRRSPRDPALLDLRARLLVERAVRSGLGPDVDAARSALTARIENDPANPVHADLVELLDGADRARGGIR